MSNTSNQIPPKSHKRRRWPWVIGAIVLAIIIIIALAPTIASTGMVRGYVVKKINAGLNGKLAIADWSLGWTSGATARGITLTGKDGKVLTIDRIDTGLTVPEAITGNYDLGNVTIQGMHFDLKINAQGQSNLQAIFQSPGEAAPERPAVHPHKTSPPAQPVAPAPPAAPAPKSKLPNVSGNLVLKDITGTIQRAGAAPVDIALNGTVKIPNINQPIDDSLNLAIGQQNQLGTVSLNGKIAAIKNNQIVDLPAMSIQQTLELRNIDLPSLATIASSDSLQLLNGQANGQIALSMAPGTNGQLQGNVQATNIVASGSSLKGDKFETKSLVLDIPKTDIGGSPAVVHTSAPIELKFDQGNLSLAIDAPLAALQNLGIRTAPGAKGSLAANAQIDFAALSKQLPHVLDLRPGLKLNSGQLASRSTLQLSTDQFSVQQHAELRDLAGVVDRDGSAARVSLDPLVLDLSTSVLPSHGRFPRLHDLVVKLDSPFASANFQGHTLANLNGQAHADLAQAQQQLGQIFDLSGYKLAGTLDANLTATGHVNRAGTPIALNSKIVVRNLEITGGSRPIRQNSAVFAAGGKLTRDASDSITGIDDLTASLQAGDANHPAIDLLATATVQLKDGKTIIPSFKLEKCMVDLPLVQQQHGALPGLPNDMQITSGVISATAAGSDDSSAIKLDSLELSVNGLTANRSETALSLLSNYSTKVELAGEIIDQPATFSIKLSRLSVNDQQQLLSAKKIGDQDLAIILPKNAPAQAIGGLQFSANLAELAQLINNLSEKPSQRPSITSGTLAGSANFSTTNSGIALNTNLKAENLSIPSSAQPIDHETLSLVMDATASADLSQANISKLDFDSSFASATGSMSLRPKLAGMAMVESASLDIKVPSVPRMGTLLAAFSSQKQPVMWNAGNADAQVDLSQSQNTLHAKMNLAASDLGFSRGSAQYQFDPIHFKAAADVSPGAVSVQSLDGSLGSIASVELIQPITFSRSSSAAQASDATAMALAQGEIRVTGDLARLNELLSAWDGKAAKQQLSGQFTLQQKFSTAGSVITAAGSLGVNNLSVAMDPQNIFREQQLALNDDLSLDNASEMLTLRQCAISTQSSGAINLNVTGAINHLSTTRDFQNLRAEVSYDLAKLIPLASPLLSESTRKTLASYKITGNQKHTITLTGSFPANQPFDQAIKQLNVTGSIGLDSLTGNGITVTNLSPRFQLRNGVFTITGDASAGQNPTFNGGAMNLTGVSYNLADPSQPLTAPDNLQLVHGANLNAQLLGSFASDLTPLLSNPKQALGILDLTLVHCRQLSLAQFNDPTFAGAGSGSAQATISVTNMSIASDMATALAAVIPSAVQGNSLTGSIRNGQIGVQNGIVSSDITVFLGNNVAINFAGNILLQNKQLDNFAINIPTSLIPDVKRNPQIAQYVPPQIPIAVKGTTTNFQLDVGDSINRLVRAALQKGAVQGVLGAITGQNQGNQPQQPSQSQQPQNKQNNLNNLLNGILGGGNNAANDSGNNGNGRKHRQKH